MLRTLLSLVSALILLGTAALAAPRIAVIVDAPWSPNDVSRDGAAELSIMLQIALLQQETQAVGVVGVGDKRGLFQDGTRRGLEIAAQRGVPVVRLARDMRACLTDVDELFINGGMLSPEAASALLTECLTRHGPLPVIHSTAKPSSREMDALRRKLKLYQAEFSARQPKLLASR